MCVRTRDREDLWAVRQRAVDSCIGMLVRMRIKGVHVMAQRARRAWLLFVQQEQYRCSTGGCCLALARRASLNSLSLGKPIPYMPAHTRTCLPRLSRTPVVHLSYAGSGPQTQERPQARCPAGQARDGGADQGAAGGQGGEGAAGGGGGGRRGASPLVVKSVVMYSAAWVKSQSRMASTSNQVRGRWNAISC